MAAEIPPQDHGQLFYRNALRENLYLSAVAATFQDQPAEQRTQLVQTLLKTAEIGTLLQQNDCNLDALAGLVFASIRDSSIQAQSLAVLVSRYAIDAPGASTQKAINLAAIIPMEKPQHQAFTFIAVGIASLAARLDPFQEQTIQTVVQEILQLKTRYFKSMHMETFLTDFARECVKPQTGDCSQYFKNRMAIYSAITFTSSALTTH